MSMAVAGILQNEQTIIGFNPITIKTKEHQNANNNLPGRALSVRRNLGW